MRNHPFLEVSARSVGAPHRNGPCPQAASPLAATNAAPRPPPIASQPESTPGDRCSKTGAQTAEAARSFRKREAWSAPSEPATPTAIQDPATSVREMSASRSKQTIRKQIVDVDTNIVVVEREMRRDRRTADRRARHPQPAHFPATPDAAAQISATFPEEIPGNLLDLERSDRAAIRAIDPLTAANGSGDRPKTSE